MSHSTFRLIPAKVRMKKFLVEDRIQELCGDHLDIWSDASQEGWRRPLETPGVPDPAPWRQNMFDISTIARMEKYRRDYTNEGATPGEMMSSITTNETEGAGYQLSKSEIKQARRTCLRGISMPDGLSPSPLGMKDTPGTITFTRCGDGFEPRDFQLEGAGILLNIIKQVKGGMLCDVVGSGKTLTAMLVIAAMLTRKREEKLPNSHILVVAPANLLPWWEAQLQLYLNTAREKIFVYHELSATEKESLSGKLHEFDVVLTSYETMTAEFVDHVTSKNDFGIRQGGFDTLRQRTGKNKTVKPLKNRLACAPLFVQNAIFSVFDEAHNACNMATNTFKACKSLLSISKLLMTGTPFQNEYTSIFAYFVLLDISPWNDEAVFAATFINRAKTTDLTAAVLDPTRRDILYCALRSVMLRRIEGDYYNGRSILPRVEKLEKVIVVECTDEDVRRLQQEARDGEELKRDGEKKKKGSVDDTVSYYTRSIIARLAAVHIRLPRQKNAPQKEHLGRKRFTTRDNIEEEVYDAIENSKNMKEHSSKLRNLLKGKCNSDKLDEAGKLIKQILDDDPQAAILLYSEFAGALECMEMHLEQLGVTTTTYDGGKSTAERNELVRRFNLIQYKNRAILAKEMGIPEEDLCEEMNAGKHRVMMLTDAGRDGLNLPAATHVILLSPTWNPERENQMIGRAVRLDDDSKDKLHIYRIMLEGSIEEKMFRRQKEKTAKATQLLNLLDWNDPNRGDSSTTTDRAELIKATKERVGRWVKIEGEFEINV